MHTHTLIKATGRDELLDDVLRRARSGERVMVEMAGDEAVYVISAADFALLRAREDAADHALIEARRDEPTTPYAEFAAELGL